MGVSLAVAGIGAAGSVAGGLLSGGGGKPSLSRSEKRAMGLERARAARQELQAELGADVAREQATATEAARLGLFTSIGDIGTYEESYEDYARRRQDGLFGAPGAAPGTGELFRDITKTGRIKEHIPYVQSIEDAARAAGISEAEVSATGRGIRKKHVGTQFEAEARGKALNVPEFLRRAKDSRQFRMVSRLTAEADQLMRREGPLWDELNTSILGGIYEGAAALGKEQTKAISDALARGGSARRQGLAVVQQMRAAEQVNRQRTQALWQSKLQLDSWIRDNARSQLQFNQQWVANHAGVRDQFSQTMENLATFYGKTIMPSALAANSAIGNTAVGMHQLANARSEQKNGIGQMVSGIGSILMGAGLKGLMGGGGGPTTQIPGQSQSNIAIGPYTRGG